VARDLVAREVLLHVLPEVVGRRGRTRPQHDVGVQTLAEPVVVDAHDGRLDDVVVADERLLDLQGIDVLAAGDDHLVVAADHVEPAGPVEPTEVPGDHEAVVERLRVAGGVALELRVAPHGDPPDLAPGDLAALVVDDPQLGADDRAAGRVRRHPQVGRGRGADQPGLGGVVGVVHHVPEAVHEPGDRVRPHPRAAGRHEPQRLEPEAAQGLLGEVDDPLEHDRHEREASGPVSLHQLERGLGVEPAAHHDGAAHARGDGQLTEAPGVEHRRGHHRGLPGTPGDPLQHRRQRRGSTAGAPGTLGRTGRAGGQQHGPAGPVGLVRSLTQVLVDEGVQGAHRGRGPRVVLPGEHLDESLDP
jgi:hypothetical protein